MVSRYDMGRPTSPLDHDADVIPLPQGPDGYRVSKLILQSGTVPLPGAGYERVNEFHAESWRIDALYVGGYRVSRGEQILDLVGLPMVIVYEPIPGAKRDRT